MESGYIPPNRTPTSSSSIQSAATASRTHGRGGCDTSWSCPVRPHHAGVARVNLAIVVFLDVAVALDRTLVHRALRQFSARGLLLRAAHCRTHAFATDFARLS